MTRQPADRLRARMQRVATKARPVPAPVRRPARPAATAAVAVRTRALPARRPETTLVVAQPQSRLATLAAWVSWELSEVPARRVRWVVALLRGGAKPS